LTGENLAIASQPLFKPLSSTLQKGQSKLNALDKESNVSESYER